MKHSIRNAILYRTYRQCLKLLGPNDNGIEVNNSFRTQWDKVFRVGNTPVPFETPDLDNLPQGYPLSKEDIEVIGNVVPDGKDARRIQHVQVGSSDWSNLKDEKLLPCIFIERAAGSFNIPSEYGNVMTGEILPLIIRLLMVQPPSTVLTFDNSNPAFTNDVQSALEYLLDPYWFKGMKEPGGFRRGYEIPSTVYDAVIVNSEGLEGVQSPYEIADFRLEVSYERQKQISKGVGFKGELNP